MTTKPAPLDNTIKLHRSRKSQSPLGETITPPPMIAAPDQIKEEAVKPQGEVATE